MIARCAAVCAALALAGCGTDVQTHAVSTQPPWPSNLGILISQLENDVALTSLAGATRGSARAALESDSNLYALLVAYDDFGVCRGMVASAAGDARAIHVTDALARACRHLVSASALFTRATTHGDPLALLAAGSEARRASPWLVRASLALRRATGLLRSSGAAGPAQSGSRPPARISGR